MHGYDTDALRVFGDEATRRPTKGAPKIGYALAAALNGDLAKGVRAMRRALRIDPDALHYVRIEEGLRSRIEGLVERYAALERSRDSNFMLAALHYLLHDLDSAERAIKLVVVAGDGPRGTVNLRDLISQERREAGAL